MTKFSVGGEMPEEDEGPSYQTTGKRQRICVESWASFSLNSIVKEEREGYLDGSRDGSLQEEVGREEIEFGGEGGANDGDEGEEIDEQLVVDSAKNLASNPKDGGDRKRVRRNCFPSVILTDPEVLDCSICFNRLAIPVFQCDNGHIACSICCSKINNKCPSCSQPIGYNRCRAIENVLESAKVSCKHAKWGCKKRVGYRNEDDNHENSCTYAPCVCPIASCSLVSSWKQLSNHMSTTHQNTTTRFLFNTMFTICLKIHDKFVVLQEENNGALFLLSNNSDRNGNAVKLSCLRPVSCKEEFVYDLRTKTMEMALYFQSVTKNVPVWYDNLPPNGFLLIHHDFFAASEQIKLDLHIWENGVLPADIQKKIMI